MLKQKKKKKNRKMIEKNSKAKSWLFEKDQ